MKILQHKYSTSRLRDKGICSEKEYVLCFNLQPCPYDVFADTFTEQLYIFFLASFVGLDWTIEYLIRADCSMDVKSYHESRGGRKQDSKNWLHDTVCVCQNG